MKKDIAKLIDMLEARGDSEQQIIGFLMGLIQGECRTNTTFQEHIARQVRFLEFQYMLDPELPTC